MSDVEINRQQFLQRPPVEPRRLCRLRVITANFSARALDRQSVDAVAVAGQNFCQTKAKNCVLATQFNVSGGAGLIGDADKFVGSTDKQIQNQMKELHVILLNLKVISTHAKAITEALGERPNRLIFGGKTNKLTPESTILKSREPLPAKTP